MSEKPRKGYSVVQNGAWWSVKLPNGTWAWTQPEKQVADSIADYLNKLFELDATSLFQHGNFLLHSGDTTSFKIDCDALSDDDIETLAFEISLRVPPFSNVEGVPTGGLRLAQALERYRDGDGGLLG